MSGNARLFEYQAPTILSSASTDGLFVERLETFLEKSLADIKAFAEREEQSYDETRKYVAQWHAKHLFQPIPSTTSSAQLRESERTTLIRPVLCEVSQILEALSTSWGVHSFILAVNPYDPIDAGFLGGSLLGREFWRGLRSGGETGARSFRTHCTTQLQIPQPDTKPTLVLQSSESSSARLGPKPNPAKSLKTELYEKVRNGLRSISGIRNAEMKWTNPERLDVYGVRLIGWPEGIPAQNPSSLKSSQNRQLLEALQSGSMWFERLPTYQVPASEAQRPIPGPQPESHTLDSPEDFSWAYDANAGQTSAMTSSSATPIAGSLPIPTTTTPHDTFPLISEPLVPSIEEPEGYHQAGWELDDPSLIHDSYNPGDMWEDIFQETSSTSSLASHAWDDPIQRENDRESDSERPRKRHKSEEITHGLDDV